MSTPSRHAHRTVVSVAPDLLIATRIATTAKLLGISLITARPEEALEICRGLKVDLIVLDLESQPDPLDLIRAFKLEPSTAAVPLVAFYPHVRNALRESALAAGADRVLPRSAFSLKLGELLAGKAVQLPDSD